MRAPTARPPRWWRPAVAAAIVAALGGAVAAAPAGAEEPWPWSAVGRVLIDGRGPCSGVLVEPRTVLTVGHCVAARRSWRAHAPQRLSVVFETAVHRVTAVRLADRSPFAPDGRLGDVRRDWAVLELAEPAAVEPVPFGGLATARLAFALDEPLIKVGWRGAGRHRDAACAILELADEALRFRCGRDAGVGRSGSALISAFGGRYEVVAVQSAEARGPAVTLGLAVIPPP